MHWPVTNSKLEKGLKRSDRGFARLGRIAKSHNMGYSKLKRKEDIWKADERMVKVIDNLPKKNVTEKLVRNITSIKRKLKL